MPKKILVRILLVVSFFVPLILTVPVWLSTRSFPVTPLVLKPIEFGFYCDVFLLLLFSLSAVWFLIKEKSKGGLFFFLFYDVFCILDQTRIQPFYFEIAFIIFFYYLYQSNFENFKKAFLLLMAGTYIWSGLHKANSVFYEFWLTGLERKISFVPLFLRQLFTWSVPFLEMSFGLALLFNKTRRLGIVLLAVMHTMVISVFIKTGVGFTVMPLNIVNVVLLFVLCYRFDWQIFNIKKEDIKLKVITFYALLLPALNLIGLWDHLLSFSYFSGRPDYCNIVFSERAKLDELPPNMLSFVSTYKNINYLNLNSWSVRSVKVLCYPEERVYKYLQDYIEVYTGKNSTTLQYYKK